MTHSCPRLRSAYLFEETGHGHAQDPRKLVQLAGTDAVGAALVLLDLLERQTQGVRQFLLGIPQEHPAKAHTSAHMDVYGMSLSGFPDGLMSKHPLSLQQDRKSVV